MGISKSIGHEKKLLTGLIVVSLLSNDIPKLIVLLLPLLLLLLLPGSNSLVNVATKLALIFFLFGMRLHLRY
ncbi:hypothetical protein PP707_04400 [Acetobacter pasteurianus]|nr:hypothetical protein [Acetobacter pasteurianus]